MCSSRRRPRDLATLPGPLLILLSCGLLGCDEPAPKPGPSPQVQAHRKKLLAAQDRRQQRIEKQERMRVVDTDGELLPSEEKVAGILMPRGMKLGRQLDGDWYYVTKQPLDTVIKYFGPRLFTGRIDQAGMGTVTYVHAEPRDTPGAPPVSVRIGPASRDPSITEVNIRRPAKAIKLPESNREVEKQMQLRRRYAD